MIVRTAVELGLAFGDGLLAPGFGLPFVHATSVSESTNVIANKRFMDPPIIAEAFR